MDKENCAAVTDFILLGFSDAPEPPWIPLPAVSFHLGVTVWGNLGMIGLIQVSSGLHTPMYFFLSCLSSVDACYSSVIAPKLLISFLVVRQTISFSACIVQHLFFGVFITTEGFLLSAMAYDRYVAIVNPLLYAAAMSKRKSVGLVIGSLIGGMINSLTHTISFGRLSFCRSKSSVTSSVMSPHC